MPQAVTATFARLLKRASFGYYQNPVLWRSAPRTHCYMPLEHAGMLHTLTRALSLFLLISAHI